MSEEKTFQYYPQVGIMNPQQTAINIEENLARFVKLEASYNTELYRKTETLRNETAFAYIGKRCNNN